MEDKVHCEWSEWGIGECSVTCGDGSRTNTRKEQTKAKNGGDTCDGDTSKVEPCKDEECPGYNKLSNVFYPLMYMAFFYE